MTAQAKAAAHAEWYQQHTEQIAVYNAAYSALHYEENKPRYRARRAAYTKQRRKDDVCFRLAGNLRSRLKSAIRYSLKAGSAVTELGCSVQHLKLHLELFWDSGMSWENYGNGEGRWSIDHIRPLASFDLTDAAQCREANHFLNLQPMWQADNRKKGDRVAA